MPSKARVLVIPVQGDVRVEEIDPQNIEELQALVGGYFEHVRVPRVPRIDLWVDEEGIRKGLDFNLRASLLVSRQILGPAVLTGTAGAQDEEIASVPDEFINIVEAGG